MYTLQFENTHYISDNGEYTQSTFFEWQEKEICQILENTVHFMEDIPDSLEKTLPSTIINSE